MVLIVVHKQKPYVKFFYKTCRIRFLVGQSISWPYEDELIGRVSFAIDKSILINALNYEYREVFDDIVSIVALLQSDNIFYNPNNMKEKIEKIREKYCDSISDHLSLRNIFKELKSDLNIDSPDN